MQHVRLHAQLLEERSMECYFCLICFLLFFHGFGQSTTNAKTIEKKNKNKTTDTMHSFETGGEVHGICHFLFSRGFGQSPKSAKGFYSGTWVKSNLAQNGFLTNHFNINFFCYQLNSSYGIK